MEDWRGGNVRKPSTIELFKLILNDHFDEFVQEGVILEPPLPSSQVVTNLRKDLMHIEPLITDKDVYARIRYHYKEIVKNLSRKIKTGKFINRLANLMTFKC